MRVRIAMGFPKTHYAMSSLGRQTWLLGHDRSRVRYCTALKEVICEELERKNTSHTCAAITASSHETRSDFLRRIARAPVSALENRQNRTPNFVSSTPCAYTTLSKFRPRSRPGKHESVRRGPSKLAASPAKQSAKSTRTNLPRPSTVPSVPAWWEGREQEAQKVREQRTISRRLSQPGMTRARTAQYGHGDGKTGLVWCNLCHCVGTRGWYRQHAPICAAIPPARKMRFERRQSRIEARAQAREEELNEAALVIQKAFRGFNTRRKLLLKLRTAVNVNKNLYFAPRVKPERALSWHEVIPPTS